MATETEYTFSISGDFPNGVVNTGTLLTEISDSSIIVSLDHIDTDEDDCNIYFKDVLGAPDETTLSGVVNSHLGEIPVDVSKVVLDSELRDTSGKLRIHQTSRKLGLRILWTGTGDNQLDPHSIGGGETFSATLSSGTLSKYIDFNCVNNETWLHEGYITWNACNLDTLTLEVVPTVVSYTVSSGTNYNLYGGYMAIPAAGDGVINITSDLTNANGGLVYMPNGDEGDTPTAFWNADWNTSTKKYENITPAPYGNGSYNIFTYEIKFTRILNEIPFLASGFIALHSSDTDQLGHGMRLKMTVVNSGNNHTLSVACMMCLHREKSV